MNEQQLFNFWVSDLKATVESMCDGKNNAHHFASELNKGLLPSDVKYSDGDTFHMPILLSHWNLS